MSSVHAEMSSVLVEPPVLEVIRNGESHFIAHDDSDELLAALHRLSTLTGERTYQLAERLMVGQEIIAGGEIYRRQRVSEETVEVRLDPTKPPRQSQERSVIRNSPLEDGRFSCLPRLSDPGKPAFLYHPATDSFPEIDLRKLTTELAEVVEDNGAATLKALEIIVQFPPETETIPHSVAVEIEGRTKTVSAIIARYKTEHQPAGFVIESYIVAREGDL